MYENWLSSLSDRVLKLEKEQFRIALAQSWLFLFLAFQFAAICLAVVFRYIY